MASTSAGAASIKIKCQLCMRVFHDHCVLPEDENYKQIAMQAKIEEIFCFFVVCQLCIAAKANKGELFTREQAKEVIMKEDDLTGS